MARIEGIRIQNYKALKDITLGGVTHDATYKLTPMTVVIGKNGVGKSSIFDAFSFLADCMQMDVEAACNVRNRGGFDRLVSASSTTDKKETKKEIKFTIYYRGQEGENPITYKVDIGKSSEGQAIVLREVLLTHRTEATKGKRGAPLRFLELEKGSGRAWGKQGDEQNKKFKEDVKLNSERLGIVILAEHIDKHPRILKFKNFIQSWYLSYFTPDAARVMPQYKNEKHLNMRGDNMANVVQYIAENHWDFFQKIIKDISQKIPGIGKIEVHKENITNNMFLLFKDKGFSTPFTQQQMSDGTLKLLCYMLLLRNPEVVPFICIEEPENELYHDLLPFLVDEFREHTETKGKASQVFVTTHQPYLVDELNPNEVWVLEKEKNGFSKITRSDEFSFVEKMKNQGLPLGSLWYSGHMDEGE